MTDEGVIKYTLDYQVSPAGDATVLAAVNAWRSLLHRLDLIACHPARYGGYGFAIAS